MSAAASACPRIPLLEELRRFPRFMRDYAGDGHAHHLRHGDCFMRRVGMRSLNVRHPRHVQQVFRGNVRNYIKNHHYRFLDPLLGQGIFVSEGELWAAQRRLLAPEFRAKEVARFEPIIHAELDALIEDWDAHASEGRAVEVPASMMHLTLCVLGGALFETDFDRHVERIAAALETCLDQGTLLMKCMGLLQPWMPTPGNLRARMARSELDAIVRELIAGARARTAGAGGCPHHVEGRGASEGAAGEASERASSGVDMTSRMLAARDSDGQPMSEAQLLDEIKSLILSGNETTSLMLSWALYLLSRHPQIAARVREEVRRVAPTGPIGAERLPELVYTRQVLLETMRLYPPVPGVAREALADDSFDGVPLYAGEDVVVSIYSLHRHPEFWPDPERFDPERFAPEREQDIEPYAYVPFLRGRRACIGEHFAMLEGVIALATILRRYTFEALDPSPIGTRPISTLRMARPLRLRVRPVEGAA